jgi:carbohydrate-selective porin OprB
MATWASTEPMMVENHFVSAAFQGRLRTSKSQVPAVHGQGGRANGAWGYQGSIRGSYVIGGAMNNPLGRSKLDQIGLAIGYAEAADPPVNPPGSGDETIVDAYWSWAFFGGLLLTPDVQYIGNPAEDTGHDGVWALSLRTTLMF